MVYPDLIWDGFCNQWKLAEAQGYFHASNGLPQASPYGVCWLDSAYDDGYERFVKGGVGGIGLTIPLTEAKG